MFLQRCCPRSLRLSTSLFEQTIQIGPQLGERRGKEKDRVRTLRLL